MACISKLNTAILFDCESGFIGINKAVLINKVDIESVTYGSVGFISAMALAAAAKGVVVDTVKKSLVVSESLRPNDGAPNAFTHEAVVNIFNKNLTPDISNALANGTLVLLTQSGPNSNLISRVYGANYGLQASASAANSHENGGWTQFTLSTPEGVIGEDSVAISSAVFNTIYSAAINS